MHYQRSHSNSFHCIAFDLMLTNDMITVTKYRTQCVVYGQARQIGSRQKCAWICVSIRRCYLHSNHRQLGEPIYASFFRSLRDEGKPSRPFLVGKKSDEFSSFIYYLVSLSPALSRFKCNSIYCNTDRGEKWYTGPCVHSKPNGSNNNTR